ncbi:hypothetical protein ABZX95_16905 [Streptomyces sp. NPDC004232]|uniref:hypothetical protein n=1 Tax=Streptomyces sp. NPDC004232 TaxID=3154454 RepID=UPI0033BA5C01
MNVKLREQAKAKEPQMLPYPRMRMNIPGTWEIFSSDGRHGGVICSQTPRRDLEDRLAHLNEKEPEGGWTYEYIPMQPQGER